MKFAPMLAQSLQPSQFPKYIADPRWVAEQKLDGERLLIKVENKIVTATNRNGDPKTVDRIIAEPFKELTGTWAFDGEQLDGKFFVFDMPFAVDLVGPDDTYDHRRDGLETVFEVAWSKEPRLRLVACHRTTQEKQDIFDWCMSQGAEGIMFKDVRGRYTPGKRGPGFQKAKFTDTADCVIMEVSPLDPKTGLGKSSCVVGLFREGDDLPTEVGSVKMTEKNLAAVSLGDVIEVKYLYFTKDERLYQARFQKFRPDKNPFDCLLDGNLRRVNKTVRESEQV